MCHCTLVDPAAAGALRIAGRCVHVCPLHIAVGCCLWADDVAEVEQTVGLPPLCLMQWLPGLTSIFDLWGPAPSPQDWKGVGKSCCQCTCLAHGQTAPALIGTAAGVALFSADLACGPHASSILPSSMRDQQFSGHDALVRLPLPQWLQRLPEMPVQLGAPPECPAHESCHPVL